MESSIKKRLASASAFMPDEILSDILSTLPSESLIRFSSVSKSWYSLIRNPDFIATHLNRSNSCNDANLLIFPVQLEHDSGNTCSVVSEETLIENRKFDFPWTSNEIWNLEVCKESCFCDGLICLASYYRTSGELYDFYLCNPSIRKVKILPSSSCTLTSLPRKDSDFYSVFGFGFDRVSCDYKVVRIFSSRLRSAKAEVYSLRTDSWKSVELTAVRHVEHMRFPSASCNGAIHWLFYADSCQASVIMCFDLCDEVFREMALPFQLSYSSRRGFIFLFKGLLSVFIVILRDEYFDVHLEYEVWVMREYGVVESWTKQFTGMVRGVCEGEVGFTKGGKVILRKYDEMLILDLENPQLEDLGFSRRLYSVSDYMESLVLLDDAVAKSEMLSHQIGEDQSTTCDGFFLSDPPGKVK